MSRLIFEGDTISRFGKKIPTPFIEKLKIYEDSIECTISIYLHITENSETNEQIYEDLSNLRLFYGLGRTMPRSVKLNLNNSEGFILVNDNIYNSEATRFAKFTFIREDEYDISTFINDRINREIYFSCFITVAQDEAGNRNLSLLDSSANDPRVLKIDRSGKYNEYRNLSSPLVYEETIAAINVDAITTKIKLATDPIQIYEDSLGLPYEHIPLQSIQKGYYKTTDSFREQLKSQVDTLIASYGTDNDKRLQSFLDSISSLSRRKSGSVTFLVELDKIRNSFPSRVSVSKLGVLYNKLKEIIFSANDALVLGETLQKKIVPNLKIIDLRGTFFSDTAEWLRKNIDSYEPRVDDTGETLYSTVLMERQQIETPKIKTLSTGEERLYDGGSGIVIPDFDVTSIFGYFFFDYEKALHKKSNLSQIYEIQKILNIFGNGALDSYFQIKRTELRKFTGNNEKRRIISPYKDSLPIAQLMLATEQNPVYEVVYLEDGPTPSLTQIPYVTPRAFETVEGLGDYRLLAFEFQDFEHYSVSERPRQSYRFNIFINDDTLDFYEMLVEDFEEQIKNLKQYLDFANDFCSYNNIDGRFNDFFVEAVKEYFQRSTSTHPWIIVPKLYAIHSDLVRDKFSGVRSSIGKFADEQINLISPENGTVENLEIFTQTVEDFYNKYYGTDGLITTQISARRNQDGTLQPSLRDNTEFIATLGYDELPDIVDFTVDPLPPTSIVLWRGDEQFVNGDDIKLFINKRSATLAAARARNMSFDDFFQENGLKSLKDLRNTRSEEERKIIKFINKFMSRLPTPRNSSYSVMKEAVEQELTLASSTSPADDLNKPQMYTELTSYDRNFITENITVFGNIGLMYIKSEKENLIEDTNQWFRDKTKDIRN